MTAPHIQRRFLTIADTVMTAELGASLRAIRDEDGVTTADLAKSLGRSKASAERYIAGERAMPFSTFVRGCKQWDGRFADGVLAYAGMRLVPIEAVPLTGQQGLAGVCSFAAKLAEALRDGIIDAVEEKDLRPSARQLLRYLDHFLTDHTRLPAPDTS
jgi:transcriptional regulator with XRE-family HTH domain